VKNITVSLDDETYRRARVKAAEMDTSVSALVKQYLSDLAAGESEFERLKKMEQALRQQVTAFRAADRIARSGARS
jgi:plasmid stability protein